MEKPTSHLSFSLSIITIFLYLHRFTLIDLSLANEQTLSLSDCLSLNKITNFSIQSASSQYEHLHKFSIQNLRVIAGDTITKPTAIILPQRKEQLANSVTCCRRSSLEITIRCGGHSYEGLSSMPRSKKPYVIIDMMNLNRVIVDVGSETAWVEGGATLGELYSTIAEHSSYHGFPAGVGPTVGVSGHFSGGGVGVLARKYGLSADNVVDAELVDASGGVLDRAEMGEDVFWALRGGGGGNFGVVYSWKVKLVKVPHVVSCFTVSKQGTNQELAKLVYKWQFVAPSLDDDFHISVYLTSSPKNEVYVTFKGFYLGPKDQALSIIEQHFPELEIPDHDCNEISWIESVLYYSGLPSESTVEDLKSRYFVGKSSVKVKSDFVREPISVDGLAGVLEILALEPKGLVLLDPMGGFMDQIDSNSIAFPHRKGNLYNILYYAFWNEGDGDGDGYVNWVRRLYDYMTVFVSSNPRAAYVNCVDLDIGTLGTYDSNNIVSDDSAVKKAKEWGEKYFLSNYDRLVRAKTMIDPENVFNHQQGIPPSYVQSNDEL